jgi:WD40-like Beta Propeller Repeat
MSFPTMFNRCTFMALSLFATVALGGQTTRVSVSSSGTQGNLASDLKSISANGRYVAFQSSATNLVADDTNIDLGDIFVYDRNTKQTSRVSISTGGVQGNNGSGFPNISADGRYVAFQSDATNLVADDTNLASDIFVYDRQAKQTSRISIPTGGGQGNDNSYSANISADGRFVAFISYASNLVDGDTNGAFDAFVHDRQTKLTSRISVTSSGEQGNSDSFFPKFSANGRFVVFDSYASNLVSGDTNGSRDVFVYDRQTKQTKRVSIASNGEQGNSDSFNTSISANGRYIGIYSRAANLIAGDTNNVSDVFVYDRQTKQTSRVSTASNGEQGNSDSYLASLSSDGRFVAFQSYASNLIVGDTNGSPDSFVYDRQTKQTSRVSISTEGVQGNAESFGPVISANGRFVALHSHADNLVAGDTNGLADVFVHDRR